MNLAYLVEQMQPMIDAAKKDPDSIPNYRVMRGLAERIKKNYNFSDRLIAQFIMAMTFSVTDPDDVDTAIDFMYSGFELIALVSNNLAGEVCPEGILEACRGLKVEA